MKRQRNNPGEGDGRDRNRRVRDRAAAAAAPANVDAEQLLRQLFNLVHVLGPLVNDDVDGEDENLFGDMDRILGGLAAVARPAGLVFRVRRADGGRRGGQDGGGFVCWNQEQHDPHLIDHYHGCHYKEGDTFAPALLAQQPCDKFFKVPRVHPNNIFCKPCVDGHNARVTTMTLSTKDSWNWYRVWTLARMFEKHVVEGATWSLAELPYIPARKVHGYLLGTRPPVLVTEPCPRQQQPEREREREQQAE